jgi:hypothetical protein
MAVMVFGEHEVRLFLIVGGPGDVRRRLPGLADRMSGPPDGPEIQAL